MGPLTIGTKCLFVEDGELHSGTISDIGTSGNTYWLDRDIARESDGSGIHYAGREELVALA